jgi:hypothetical protein
MQAPFRSQRPAALSMSSATALVPPTTYPHTTTAATRLIHNTPSAAAEGPSHKDELAVTTLLPGLPAHCIQMHGAVVSHIGTALWAARC